ncbi:putative F-box protein At5g55150 [Telopea speciosissima]|uniref:putative F-box protein At5g55150 n=1 Tax=Telopea speciosissima TaxID=54955 RepID=UPI001CC4F228|nr:putative F-box protein At5g55150 [Telopea speciosissima]
MAFLPYYLSAINKGPCSSFCSTITSTYGGGGDTNDDRKRLKNYSKTENCDYGRVLPEQIMIVIANKLDFVSFHRFSAVCKSWQSAAKNLRLHHHFLHKPQQLPWLMLSSSESEFHYHNRGGCRLHHYHHYHGFYSLFHAKAFRLQLPQLYGARCCGSNWGWLIMVEVVGNNNMTSNIPFLLNPFTRVRIQLPLQSTLPPPTIIIRTRREGLAPEQSSPNYIRRAMLLSPPSAANNLDGDCLVVAIFNTHSLAFCRAGDRAWTPIAIAIAIKNRRTGKYFEDIIFYDGKLYAITLNYDRILVELVPHPKETSCNIAPPAAAEEEEEKDHHNYPKSVYLVECVGELLMVIKWGIFVWGSEIPETNKLKIFKLDLQDRCWIKVEDLGDQMLFIGTNTGFSVSAALVDHRLFKGNCIYFIDEYYSHLTRGILFGDNATHELGVFHLKDNRCEKSYLLDYSRSSLSPPIWLTLISW